MTFLPLLTAALAGSSALAAPSASVGKPLETLNGCAFADTSCESEIAWTSACCRAGNCHYDRHADTGACVPVVTGASSFDHGHCWVAESSTGLLSFGTQAPESVYANATLEGETPAKVETEVWDEWALRRKELYATAETNFEQGPARTYAQAMAERHADESTRRDDRRQFQGPQWVQVATFNLGDCSSIPRGSIMTGSLRIVVAEDDEGLDVPGSVKGMLGSLARFLNFAA